MGNPVFKFCGENIKKPVEHEELTIDKFNDDMVEVIRKFDKEHPDIRLRGTQEPARFIVRNFGYKNVDEAMEYFNKQLKA